MADAVEYGSFDHMRELEEAEAFGSEKLRPGRRGDVDTYKTRRGKVGGHRDELTAEQIARLDRMLAASGASRFGYWWTPDDRPDAGSAVRVRRRGRSLGHVGAAHRARRAQPNWRCAHEGRGSSPR